MCKCLESNFWNNARIYIYTHTCMYIHFGSSISRAFTRNEVSILLSISQRDEIYIIIFLRLICVCMYHWSSGRQLPTFKLQFRSTYRERTQNGVPICIHHVYSIYRESSFIYFIKKKNKTRAREGGGYALPFEDYCGWGVYCKTLVYVSGE